MPDDVQDPDPLGPLPNQIRPVPEVIDRVNEATYILNNLFEVYDAASEVELAEIAAFLKSGAIRKRKWAGQLTKLLEALVHIEGLNL
jgi:hypothetical protein